MYVPFSRAYKILNGFSSLQRMHTLYRSLHTYDKLTCVSVYKIKQHHLPIYNVYFAMGFYMMLITLLLCLTISLSLSVYILMASILTHSPFLAHSHF